MDLENHWEDLICPIDVNDWYGSGTFDEAKAQNFMVVFEKCDQAKETAGRTGIKCLSEQEINEWLVYKYIMTLTNEVQFKEHNFEEHTRI